MFELSWSTNTVDFRLAYVAKCIVIVIIIVVIITVHVTVHPPIRMSFVCTKYCISVASVNCSQTENFMSLDLLFPHM
jgi:hypothetical protein